MKKVLVCCKRMVNEHGTMVMEATIPSWGDEIITFSVSKIPFDVLKAASKFPDDQKRFFAKINPNAKTASELGICEFEDLRLFEIFRREEDMSYRPYFPIQLEQWRAGKHEAVALELLQQPMYYLAVFCSDVYNTSPNEEEAKKQLAALSTTLLAIEKESPTTAKGQALLELLNRWDDGSCSEPDKWDEVAQELINRSRYELVIFCSNVYQTRPRVDALLQTGFLAGTLSRLAGEIGEK